MLDGGPWDSLGIGTWYAAHMQVGPKQESIAAHDGREILTFGFHFGFRQQLYGLYRTADSFRPSENRANNHFTAFHRVW